MDNRALNYTFFLLVCIFLLGYIFVTNIIVPSGEPVRGQLNTLAGYASQGRWSDAEKTVDCIEKTWNGVKYLIAVNYAEPDFTVFSELIARLREAVAARDAAEVAGISAYAMELWNKYISFIPQP